MPQPIETESIPATVNPAFARWLDGPHIIRVDAPTPAEAHRLTFEVLVPASLTCSLVQELLPGARPWTAFLLAPDRAALIARLHALVEYMEQQP